ncbi:WXG100 family type VII secretion target [Micrococcus lylae]|nr:WXG100 family type VII secretion target [Micrococcus lylae]
MGFSLEMTDINVFQKANSDSAVSGEELLQEVENLRTSVEALQETFKGQGADSYKKFMVAVNDAQNKLSDALGKINVGQADVYQSYLTQEDEQVATAEPATSEAESFSFPR